jgi:hypothetical protein
MVPLVPVIKPKEQVLSEESERRETSMRNLLKSIQDKRLANESVNQVRSRVFGGKKKREPLFRGAKASQATSDVFEINRYLKREKVDGDKLPRLDGSLNILDFSLSEDKPITDENKSSNERSV